MCRAWSQYSTRIFGENGRICTWMGGMDYGRIGICLVEFLGRYGFLVRLHDSLKLPDLLLQYLGVGWATLVILTVVSSTCSDALLALGFIPIAFLSTREVQATSAGKKILLASAGGI